MKSYPSIATSRRHAPRHVWGFDKLDGSNIRVEWNLKQGFYKFGTRTRLLAPGDKVFGGIPDLFAETCAEPLHRIFREQRWKKVLVFFEFWGPGSIAGSHDLSTPKTLSLIDAAPDNRGLLHPRAFLDVFDGKVETAPLLYSGPLTEEVVEDVRQGDLPGITHEGVVFKGPPTKPGRPWMTKVKTEAWLEALREFCGGDKSLFEKLK